MKREYTLSHGKSEGTAGWLYFDFLCGNIDPSDYDELSGILDSEGMLEAAEAVREAVQC